MKIQTYLALFGLLITLGCNKDQYVAFSGTLTNETNGAKVSGATVELWETKDLNGTVIITPIFTASTTSDANGNYSISTEPAAATEYFLRINDNNYFFEEQRFLPSSLSRKDDNKVDFILSPKGNVFIEADPINASTVIQVFKRGGTILGEGSCPNGEILNTSTGINFTTCALEADTYFRYEFRADRSGALISGIDSIYVNQGDTSQNKILIRY